MNNFLSIFFQSNNSFEGEEAGEDVFLLLRRHIFVLYAHLTFILLPAFLPLILGLLFFSSLQTYNLMTLFILLSSILYTVLWLMAFYVLTMYTLDVWIVTDRRIIDTNQVSLFHRNISELHLPNVQDISVKTKGIIETMCKFGNVEIQTAAAENKFTFSQIPNPEKVKDTIMSLVGARNVEQTQTEEVQK